MGIHLFILKYRRLLLIFILLFLLSSPSYTSSHPSLIVIRFRQRERSRRESERKNSRSFLTDSNADILTANTSMKDATESDASYAQAPISAVPVQSVAEFTRLPKNVFGGHRIDSVACGWDHTLSKSGMWEERDSYSYRRIIVFSSSLTPYPLTVLPSIPYRSLLSPNLLPRTLLFYCSTCNFHTFGL